MSVNEPGPSDSRFIQKIAILVCGIRSKRATGKGFGRKNEAPPATATIATAVPSSFLGSLRNFRGPLYSNA